VKLFLPPARGKSDFYYEPEMQPVSALNTFGIIVALPSIRTLSVFSEIWAFKYCKQKAVATAKAASAAIMIGLSGNSGRKVRATASRLRAVVAAATPIHTKQYHGPVAFAGGKVGQWLFMPGAFCAQC